VWKVTVAEGDQLDANATVAILEAMKLEIAVRAEDGVGGEGAVVEKLLVRPGDVVKGGDGIVLVRRKKT